MDELTDCVDLLNIHDDNPNEDNTNAVPLCNEMCPEEEMIFREENGLLHLLELTDSSRWIEYVALVREFNLVKGYNFTDNDRCVKEYQRPSAGEDMYQMSRIRPTNVLKWTIDYLLYDCLQIALDTYINDAQAFIYYYDFTFDRIRSIRQDLTIQRAMNADCCFILEKAIEFYIESHKLTLHFSNDVPKFNSNINMKHLQESLFLLIEFYDHFNDNFWSLSRPEYETLFIMFNLNPERESIAFERCKKLRLNKLTEDLYLNYMKDVQSMINCYVTSNHCKMLRLIRNQKDELIRSLFFIITVPYHHLEYLKIITIAYKSADAKLPLSEIANWFCPKAVANCNKYVEQFCRNYSLPIDPPKVEDFNYDYIGNYDEEEEEDVPKYLLLKEKFNVNEWTIPAKIRPLDWLPKESKNIFYCYY